MFSTDNNNTKQYWEPNQHIIISVGSRDRLKTGEIAAENFSFDRINYILKSILKQLFVDIYSYFTVLLFLVGFLILKKMQP